MNRTDKDKSATMMKLAFKKAGYRFRGRRWPSASSRKYAGVRIDVVSGKVVEYYTTDGRSVAV